MVPKRAADTRASVLTSVGLPECRLLFPAETTPLQSLLGLEGGSAGHQL